MFKTHVAECIMSENLHPECSLFSKSVCVKAGFMALLAFLLLHSMDTVVAPLPVAGPAELQNGDVPTGITIKSLL